MRRLPFPRFLFSLLLLAFAGLAHAQQAEVDLVGGRDAAGRIANRWADQILNRGKGGDRGE